MILTAIDLFREKKLRNKDKYLSFLKIFVFSFEF